MLPYCFRLDPIADSILIVKDYSSVQFGWRCPSIYNMSVFVVGFFFLRRSSIAYFMQMRFIVLLLLRIIRMIEGISSLRLCAFIKNLYFSGLSDIPVIGYTKNKDSYI